MNTQEPQLPTNKELLGDFHRLIAAVFVTAYSHDFVSSEKMEKGLYGGKRVGHLVLRIACYYAPTVDGCMAKESLSLRVATEDDAMAVFEIHPLFKNNHSVSDKMGLAGLSVGQMNIGDFIDPDRMTEYTVVGDWNADFYNRRFERHVGTHKEKYAKPSIISGNDMARRSLAYLKDDANYPRDEADILEVLFPDENEEPRLIHAWQLPYVSDMILSGYEPKAWLRQQREITQERLARQEGYLAKYKNLGAPGVFSDKVHETINRLRIDLAKINEALRVAETSTRDTH